MGYVAVILASLFVTVLGFAIECAHGNIIHVRNGRDPNAGAALFPNIPFVPATAVGIAWLFNQWCPTLGTWGILILSVAYVPYGAWHIRRLNAELRTLVQASKEDEIASPHGQG